MIIFGIDPGPEKSGVAFFDTEKRAAFNSSGDLSNEILIQLIRSGEIQCDQIAIEVIVAMYAHVGAETVRTIRFMGRLEEAAHNIGKPVFAASPAEVKKIVCGTASAKDPAVRQALIDQLGAAGTKKQRGPTYGVTKHAWRALAVAVAAADGGS